MISKKAYIEGAYSTNELIDVTAELLRYSLDNLSKTSDLQGEIECTENYIYIQQRRLGSRVKITLAVDPNLPNIAIPGMIVQPIIENSIMHGLKDSICDGKINVAFYSKNGSIYIMVEDNGRGMSEKELEDCSIRLEQTKHYEKNHIGLFNIKRRLEMLYGDRFKIDIESSFDCGTIIILSILTIEE